MKLNNKAKKKAKRQSAIACQQDCERNLIQTLFAHHPDFIYFKDSKARFVRVCKRCYSFLGLNKEDIIGKIDLEVFAKEAAKQSFKEDMQIIKTGKPLINKEENVWGISVLTTKMPWFDESGNIIGLFGISRDITERKKAESDLKQKNIVLSELITQIELEKNKLKDNLATNVSELILPNLKK